MQNYDNKFYTYVINELLQLVYALRKAKKNPNTRLEDILKEFNIPTQFAKAVFKNSEAEFTQSPYSDDLSFESLIGSGFMRMQSVSNIIDNYKSVRDFTSISVNNFYGLDVSPKIKVKFLDLMLDNDVTFIDGNISTVKEAKNIIQSLCKIT